MSIIDSIDVSLASRVYPIKIGSKILGDAQLLHHLPHSRVLVVTNTTVAPLYLQTLLDLLSGVDKLESLVLPDGEVHKNWSSVETIIDTLLEHQYGRDTTLIALGGGVIGDMVGFAASCYQRGVPFIQVPTTLLAQVDASVGGKTGINHPAGKNMIGSFYQPNAVWIDLNTLETLPDREYRAGLAEVVKYAALWDQKFFLWLEDHVADIAARDTQVLQYMVRHCCSIKADIVAQDEREQGLRALLNLGHTFAHALEADTQYGVYLHGEAVAIGLMMAATVSERLGWLESTDVLRLKKLLLALGIPLALRSHHLSSQLYSLMRQDKKNREGRIHFVLLERLGQAKLIETVSQNMIQQMIEDYV